MELGLPNSVAIEPEVSAPVSEEVVPWEYWARISQRWSDATRERNYARAFAITRKARRDYPQVAGTTYLWDCQTALNFGRYVVSAKLCAKVIRDYGDQDDGSLKEHALRTLVLIVELIAEETSSNQEDK